MATHEFGGKWTEEKLAMLQKYLRAYTLIFDRNEKARKLTSIYVDAFAGTGHRTNPKHGSHIDSLFPELEEPEAKALLKGSVQIALEVDPPFKQYIFIENSVRRVQELEALKNQHIDKADNILIEKSDANSFLKRWCTTTNWRTSRSVVFLDPYGMQVDWDSLEAIARTQAIDLWLLFPFGIGVNRLLTKGHLPPVEWSNSLTRIFGTNNWEEAFYSRNIHPGLFDDDERHIKDADFQTIKAFFVNRLKTIFPAVADNPKTLFNSTRSPLYLLCFATANPSRSVQDAALRIANHILKN